MKFIVGIISVLIIVVVEHVTGHGRLMDPVSRSSMWRKGFETPKNFYDDGSNCGGFAHHFGAMEGKCGICGDAYDANPRENEAPGGKYANGIIVKQYKAGEIITVTVDVVVNHWGYFTFKLCANNNIHQDPTQECFDQTILKVGPDFSSTKYYYPFEHQTTFRPQVALPENVTCEQCILQWTYVAGSNWGTCEDGHGGLGCGNQEHFRACADIEIV